MCSSLKYVFSRLSNGYLVPLDADRPIVPHDPSAVFTARVKTPEIEPTDGGSGDPSQDVDPALVARLLALDDSAPDYPERKALLLWGTPMVNPGKVISCRTSW